MQLIFLIHCFSTFFMTGLCWFVQVVHYPLFRLIEPKKFRTYERKNVLLTGIVAVPVMAIESLSGFFLLYLNPSFLNWTNIVFLVLIGLSTFLFQAPIHLLLMKKPTPQLIHKLIRSNWIRTASWSIRSCILIYLITLMNN